MKCVSALLPYFLISYAVERALLEKKEMDLVHTSMLCVHIAIKCIHVFEKRAVKN